MPTESLDAEEMRAAAVFAAAKDRAFDARKADERALELAEAIHDAFATLPRAPRRIRGR